MSDLMREDVLYVSSDYAEKIISRYTGQRRKELVTELNDTLRKLKFYTNSDFAFKDVHNEELFLQNGKVLVEMVQLLQPYRIVESGDVQFLGDLFEQLLNQGFKQNEGQFFTPMPITRFIWRSLPLENLVRDIKGGVRYPRIIDYACGAGHFLTEGFEEITNIVSRCDPYFEDYAGDADWVRDNLVGVEKDYRLARASRVALYMHGAGQGEIVFGDGLENYPDKGIDGRKDAGRFDILAANPPYSVATFKPHLQLRNNELKILDVITNSGSEIETLFVERAAQLVRPGGYAVIILPSSILDKSTNSSFIAARDVLLSSFELAAIARFGSGTFAATGTNVVIMFMRRFNDLPTRDASAQDFADAVIEDKSLAGWKDSNDFSSYLNKIGTDEANYRSFIRRERYWEDWSNDQHFTAYASVFASSRDLKSLRNSKAYKAADNEERQNSESNLFYKRAHEEERKRLRMWGLLSGKRTLVVNSPTATNEVISFLGYKWSNRKGSEGIQILEGGGALYADDPDADDSDKLCGIIRAWLEGEETRPGDLSQWYYYASTADFVDFNSQKFDITLKMPRTFYRQRSFSVGIDVKTLGDIASYVVETVPQSKIVTKSYVTTENMSKGRKGIVRYEGDAPATSGTSYQNGDILISNIRPYLQKIWLADHDGACSKDVLVIRSRNKDKVLPEFLYLLLWQKDFFEYDMSTFTGTGRPRGDKDQIMKYRVPIPRVDEQRKLVTRFSQLAEEIDAARKRESDLRGAVRAKFEEFFNGPQTDGWKLATISELSRDIHYGTSAKAGKNGSHTYLRMNNITDDGLLDLNDTKRITLNKQELENALVRNGDLLFNRTNSIDKVGKTCVFHLDTPMVIAGYIVRVRFDNPATSDYVSAFLNSREGKQRLRDMAKGSVNQANISASEMGSIQIPVPPLSLQQEFSNYAKSINAKCVKLEKQIEVQQLQQEALLDKYLVKPSS